MCLRFNIPPNFFINGLSTIQTSKRFSISGGSQIVLIFPYHLWIYHEYLKGVKTMTNLHDIQPKRVFSFIFMYMPLKVILILRALRPITVTCRASLIIRIITDLYKIYGGGIVVKRVASNISRSTIPLCEETSFISSPLYKLTIVIFEFLMLDITKQ